MINFALIQHNDEDNTKPSRWKRVSLQDLLTHGLTQHDFLTYSDVTGKALPVGCSSPISMGVQSPLKTVVFLCQKISTVIKSAESFCYGVVIWGAERLAAPMRGTANPLNHAAQCLAANGGGYSILSIGSPL